MIQNAVTTPFYSTQDGFSASFGQQDSFSKPVNILPDDVTPSREVYLNRFDPLDTSALTVKKGLEQQQTPTRVAPLIRLEPNHEIGRGQQIPPVNVFQTPLRTADIIQAWQEEKTEV